MPSILHCHYSITPFFSTELYNNYLSSISIPEILLIKNRDFALYEIFGIWIQNILIQFAKLYRQKCFVNFHEILIGHVNSIHTMQFFTEISRNTQ